MCVRVVDVRQVLQRIDRVEGLGVQLEGDGRGEAAGTACSDRTGIRRMQSGPERPFLGPHVMPLDPSPTLNSSTVTFPT